MENKKEVIAFKDFKSSVSVLEFEAILEVVQSEYDKMNRIFKSKLEFEAKSKESLENIQSQAEGMPPGLLEKLMEGLDRKANKHVLDKLSDEISRHTHVTDFLNRFRETGDQLKYLEFNFKSDK